MRTVCDKMDIGFEKATKTVEERLGWKEIQKEPSEYIHKITQLATHSESREV